MKKLEQYLDQVCQSIGGPWEMRQHVRQEMREHLSDAVAQHKAAGMTDEQALDQAIDEFGKPDEVRSELEAAHGQRMTWIIDKALEWKEKTMRAKWLWMTWAYIGLVSVIALEVLFITFNVLYIIPKFEMLLRDGMIDSVHLEEQGVSWMARFLFDVSYVSNQHALLLVVVSALAWGLFEWRVRSENKPFMRLAALGTAAVALMCVVVLMAASLVIPFCLAMPALGAMSRPWAVERVTSIDTAVAALEKAQAKKDWPAMHEHAKEALQETTLLLAGPGVTSLVPRQDSGKANDLRRHVRGVQIALSELRLAASERDERKIETALKDFRTAFDPVREAAKKPGR